jgi:translocation and assembly module TamB
MENKGKLEASLKEGLINVQNFELSGNSTELKISGNKDKKDNLKFTAEGSLDLSLFAFLTPFFQDMRGTLKLNAQVAGKTAKPEFLGNAFINKGYFKLKTFPHPFEEIKSDILFSQSRVVINSIKGLLGGGELSAAGNVFIKDFRDIPVDIAGDLSHTTLNIPEGLTTTGTGRFRITGNWFPYLLKADHNIESGLYSKNFGTDTNSELMKRSTFLPKNILLKESSSLEFDLNTHFSKGVTVRNNLVDTDVKGNLKIKGDTQKSILTGELETLPGGKFYFRETPFSISSAKVKFDNPAENNPQIYAVGTSRVREWDVSLIYQGTLDKHEIKLSSTPPLPERSIVSLLALGTTDDDLEKTRSNSLQALQGYQAGGVLLEQNPLLQDFKRKTGVVVKFTQSVDDTRNIISPHFVAQKDWTPNFSTSLGRTTGSRSSNDFKMEFRLNRNISVLGSYEQRDYDQFSVSTLPNSASLPVPAGTQPTTTTDIFGVDLQYQLEFR